MSELLEVNVTAECIERGYKSHSAVCPIALALRAAGLRSPRVNGEGFTYRGDGARVLYAELPDKARRFVGDFDGDKAVAPITFHLADMEIDQCPSS